MADRRTKGADRSFRALVCAATLLAGAGAGLMACGLQRHPPPRPVAAVAGERGAAGSIGPGAPRREQAAAGPRPPVLGRSAPVRLDIPSIDVHAPVVPIGLNSDRTVEVPSLGRDSPVGWYRYLASPGEEGPAVLLGHVDSARDGPAVFYRLGELLPAAVVSVGRADGSTAIFRVVAVAEYAKAAFPSRAVYGATGSPVLRLVTCGGDFDRARGSYRDNIVVYATLTGGTPALSPGQRRRAMTADARWRLAP